MQRVSAISFPEGQKGLGVRMNAKELKKPRREMREFHDRPHREYVDQICRFPLWNKLLWCRFILTHKECRV